MYEEHIQRVNINGKEIVLLGTAHVSKESAEEVRAFCEAEHPDSICIELDKDRYSSMTNPKKWEDTNIVDVIKKKQALLLLANIILSGYQRRMAKKMDSDVGKEMNVAIQCSKDYNTELVLADRSVQTTFKRIWRKHSLMEKAKILSALLFSNEADEEITKEDIEALKNSDMLDAALKEVSDNFPTVYEVLVEERNRYLAYNIRNAKGPKVLAVLGAAHVPGIMEEIQKEYSIDELDTVKPKTAGEKLSGWIIPVIILGLILFSFTKNTSLGLAQLKSWILINGTFSALGCLLCLAHPVTILVAFIAAPITSMNPLLAAGWFAGLTESMIRKPTVADFQNIYSDISSLKTAIKNRVIKILAVVIMANVFSSIATIVSGLDIIQKLISK